MKNLLPVAIALTLTPVILAMPPVFSDLTFEEAKAQAAEQDKLLIVDGTAEWCGPCKQMDRTTWVDPDIVEWIEAKAIAIQVDVDHQPDTAKELNITAMPTIIAFRGDTELGRFVGYRDAHETLRWLKLVEGGRGEGIIDDSPLGLAPDQQKAIDARLHLATEAWFEDQYDEGLEHVVWLWEEAPREYPSWRRHRAMMLSSTLWQYASDHNLSRAQINSWRDEATQRLQTGDADYADLDDWLCLSHALELESEIVDWMLRIADRENADRALRRLSAIGYEAHQLLIEFGHWEFAGRMIQQPATAIQKALFSAHTNRDMMRAFMGDGDEELFDDEYFDFSLTEDLRSAVQIWAALEVAHRPEANAALTTLLSDSHASQVRLLLVETALEADVVSEQCLDWLDEAAHEGESVDVLQRRTLRRLHVMGIDIQDRTPAPPLPKTQRQSIYPGY